MSQWILINGKPTLVFYDTGATLNLVVGSKADGLGMTCIDPKPTNVTVVGGKVMSTEFGTYRFDLGPDSDSAYHQIHAQGIPEITVPLPKHEIRSIAAEVEASVGDQGRLPEYIGGGSISLLLGVKHPDLHPVHVLTLPSGLGVYRSRLTDVFGSNIVFGGYHPSFANNKDENAKGKLICTIKSVVHSSSAEDDLEELFQSDYNKYKPVSRLDAPDKFDGQ